jgi:hypothetical protein
VRVVTVMTPRAGNALPSAFPGWPDPACVVGSGRSCGMEGCAADDLHPLSSRGDLGRMGATEACNPRGGYGTEDVGPHVDRRGMDCFAHPLGLQAHPDRAGHAGFAEDSGRSGR